MYRSFVRCDDPKGVIECKTIRISKNDSKKLESEIERKEMISKRITEGLFDQSSFKPVEVSKGAQKLNRSINDSWSKGITFDCHSKEVAKDLLKGALDLQESLIMLGKLQEASQYMAKFKKKTKRKSRGGKVDEMGSERTNSNGFGDQNFQMGFQKPRHSADGSSRDCYEELRLAIKDGLARQNVLAESCRKEKAYGDRDISCSSSSQSSVGQSHNFAYSDSSPSSKAPEKKSSGPNLIAKLMGLNDIPTKQFKSDKKSNERKSLFSIDMQSPRKPRVVVQEEDPQRRKLKEVLESLQFKGLLRSNSVEEFNPTCHQSSTFWTEKRCIDDSAPIVLLKPLRASQLDEEEARADVLCGEEGDLSTKEIFRTLKIKEELPPKTVDFNCNEIQRNVKDGKEVHAKPEEKEVKNKGKLSKIKASVPVNDKAKKEAIQRKCDKTQKVKPNRRKPVDAENVKSEGVPRSHVQAKVTTGKLNNPKKVSNPPKNRITQPESTTSSPVSRCKTPTVKKSKNAKAVENVECKEDAERNNTALGYECDMTTIDTASADELRIEEEADAPEVHGKDHCKDSQSSLCEITQQAIQLESSIKTNDSNEKKISKTKKDVLLNSSLFLNRAKELFDLNANQPISFQTIGVDDSGTADTRLLLDYANERMELKSLRCSGTLYSSLHSPIQNSRIRVSINKLADEILNGIEHLRIDSKFADEKLPTDNLFVVLERDMWCKGVVSGIWDLGWRDGFTFDEVEQVVGDIEKLVLSSLLEEVLTGFVF